MTRRSAWGVWLTLAGLLAAASWQAADACSPAFLLRPSLTARFWQPSVRGFDGLPAGPGREKPDPGRAYAGMAKGGAPPVQAARDAYARVAAWRAETYPEWQPGTNPLHPKLAADARAAAEAALAAKPSAEDAEEMRLILCKVSLREAESVMRGDPKEGGFEERRRAALEKARQELTAFVAAAKTPLLASEGRGWLARCHHLLGEPHRAIRMYLDELDRADSAFTRAELELSLGRLMPYNGSDAGLADHLDEYFDTPRHALFAVGLVTNPVVNSDEERKAMAVVGKKALDALERHRALFAQGEGSDLLAVASMRACLYAGDPARALRVAQALPKDSAALRDPEARWMQGVAHVLLDHYAEAEPHLAAAAGARDAPAEPRGRAFLGLLAVYQKLGRPVDQLLTALRYEAWAAAADRPGATFWAPPVASDWLMDVSYLLDVQLTDEQVRAVRASLAREPLRVQWLGEKVAAADLVDYALAVRAARRGDYAAAAALFDGLHESERAARMKEAGRLCGPGGDGPPALQGRFDCAAFLAAHPDRLFFNDRLWSGFQRMGLLRGWPAPDLLGASEHAALLENERRFQDAQEERWRAFLMFDAVAQQAGHTALGTRAARQALECLARLAGNDRFGRADDIKAARKRLGAWLRGHPAAPS